MAKAVVERCTPFVTTRAGKIAWKEFDPRRIDHYWFEEFDRRYRAIGDRHPGILHRLGSSFSGSPAICISDLAIGNDGTGLSAKALDSLAIWTSEEDIWPYLVDLAEACAFLHRNHIVHGNLHPANVFIDQGGGSRVAVSDFGQGTARTPRRIRVHRWLVVCTAGTTPLSAKYRRPSGLPLGRVSFWCHRLLADQRNSATGREILS